MAGAEAAPPGPCSRVPFRPETAGLCAWTTGPRLQVSVLSSRDSRTESCPARARDESEFPGQPGGKCAGPCS